MKMGANIKDRSNQCFAEVRRNVWLDSQTEWQMMKTETSSSLGSRLHKGAQGDKNTWIFETTISSVGTIQLKAIYHLSKTMLLSDQLTRSFNHQSPFFRNDQAHFFSTNQYDWRVSIFVLEKTQMNWIFADEQTKRTPDHELAALSLPVTGVWRRLLSIKPSLCNCCCCCCCYFWLSICPSSRGFPLFPHHINLIGERRLGRATTELSIWRTNHCCCQHKREYDTIDWKIGG